MPLPTPHFAALRYLDFWLLHDERNCADLAPDQPPEVRRQALVRIATVYKVSRNFWGEHEAGHDRLNPVRVALEAISEPPTQGNVNEYVTRFMRELHGIYHQMVLSAASKILWHRFRDPVIIFDNISLEALQGLGYVVEDGNYHQFITAWQAAYNGALPGIIASCANLPAVIQYSWHAPELRVNQVEVLAHEEWFRRRVFDFMLWYYRAPY